MANGRRKISNKAGRGGARKGAGRRSTSFSTAADVKLESARQGSRKAGLVEVANRRYKSVVEKKGLDKAMERARKAYENRAQALDAAIEATPGAGWPTPALDAYEALEDDTDEDPL